MRRPSIPAKFTAVLVAALGVTYALPLLAQASLGTYSRYMADDFCTAAVAKTLGLLQAERYWYLGWSGRYAYLFFVDTASLIGPGVAPVLPALLMGLWVLAAFGSLRQIAPPWRPARPVALVLAGLLVAATLSALPNVTQSLDWRNSSLTYVAPLIASCWLAGLMLRASADAGNPPWCWLTRGLLIFGLAVLAGGFSEIYTAVQFAAFGLGLAGAVSVAVWRRAWRATGLWLSGLVGSAVALAAIALAPGTHARQSTFAPPPGLRPLIGNSIQYSRWFVRDAFLHQGVLLAAVALGCLWLVAATAPAAPAYSPPRRWLMAGLVGVPILLFGLLVTSYAPIFYALQYLPPDRVLVIQWFITISATALWGALAGWLVAPAWQAASQARPWAARAALGLAAALTMVPAFLSAAQVVGQFGAAQSYASTWDSYDQMLQAAVKGSGVVTLARQTTPGGIDDLNADPQFWVNQCLTQYYGVPVRAVPPPPIPSPAELAQGIPVQAEIGGVARVLGYQVDKTTVRPGGTVSVTVYWLPTANTDQPYTVFAHLYDPVAGSLGQSDGYPAGGSYLTTVWIHGQPFADTYAVPIRADAPSGTAMFILGLYDLQTGKRLPVSGPDAGPPAQAWVQFGQVQVTR